MDTGPSRSNLKRPFTEDDDSNEQPSQKRVRFPKGKKVKEGDYVVDLRKQAQGIPEDRKDPRLAAKQRAIQRNKMTSELFSEENRGMLKDITKAEVTYQDNETFVDDGIQIEPFNLENEREQGYFDAEGNFVEYVDDNEIKDAWLDSIDVDTKYAEKNFMVTNEDDSSELSSEAIGRMKRRIADALEPGETVLRALRRLKGTSNSKKEKMPAETKVIFEQLTEDAMKLMENGDYNVYDERQEDFQREAEGYESLAQARGEGTSMNSQRGTSDNKMANACLFSRKENGITSSLPSETVPGDDTFDMFAEDDENTTANAISNANNLTSNANNLVSGINRDDGQPSRTGDMENDYVYDDSSGYYYSSSLGYYYDPSSGFYCCAASGQWYSYNEETGVYDEIQQASSTLS